jgi:hypothetical protein
MVQLIAFFLSLFSLSAHAQLNFDVLKQAPSFAESFQKGQRDALEMQRMRQETERIRQETERMRLENEQRRRQIEDARRLAETQVREDQARRVSDEVAIKKWFEVAQPRMHLHSEFNRVVFAPDLRLTIPMIRIMTESKYAADIAYFLGNNKPTALEISNMDSARARTAISVIEMSIREKELADAQDEVRKLRAALAKKENERAEHPTKSEGAQKE